MKLKYISQITCNLKQYKTIRTSRVTSRILDGSYRSVYKGRSMNFDELREYVVGDDVKDIDWKASARSQKLLVKQYIAEKKHNIMLVLDTNRRMLADTPALQEKQEVALMGAGTLAYLINQNGDYTGAIFPTKQSLQYFPFKTGLMHIENILERYHQSVTMENHSSINTALDYIVRNFRRNMILVIVTDLQGIMDIPETTLKRLMVMNDVLMLNVGDAKIDSKPKEPQSTTPLSQNITGSLNPPSRSLISRIRSAIRPAPAIYSLEREDYLSAFFTEDKKLAKLQEEKQQKMYEACVSKLKKHGISFATVNHISELEQTITTSVTLQLPFSYAILPLILLGILIIGYGIYLFICAIQKRRRKKPALRLVNPPAPADIRTIKGKYLTRLENIRQALCKNQITTREAYQQMSLCIRHFVYEVTGIQVQNCTLEDIRKLHMPGLEALIAEYYAPEFAVNSQGDSAASLEKTKRVIELWN